MEAYCVKCKSKRSMKDEKKVEQRCSESASKNTKKVIFISLPFS
jgi:PHP family Zn ribbon phosphoesterase